MASRVPEADPKVQLGELLKSAREQHAKHNKQEAVATALQVDRTTISKYEMGERLPNAQLLARWLDLLGVDGLARLAIEKVHRLARFSDGSAAARIWFAGYLEAEVRAHLIRIWQPIIVPGLLQTEAYAAELFGRTGHNKDRVMSDVETRLARQEILERDSAPTVIVVLWEHVLYHQIGTPEVMYDQIARILELSEQGVIVHVLPASEGANSGLGGPISLATGHNSEVVLTGSLLEDVVTADLEQVRAASGTFEHVRANAANLSASRKILMEAIEKWKTQATGGRPATAETAARPTA